MGCCCRNRNNPDNWKKTAVLTILRPELLQDIAGMGYVEGDMIKTDDEHERHQVQDIVEDGNVERVTRVLDLTFAEITELMYPYTKQPSADDARFNDIYREDEAYRLKLRLPDDFSDTTLRYIEKLAHELMTCRVMADWCSITKPSSADNWAAKAEGVKASIKSALLNRGNKTRRGMSPF